MAEVIPPALEACGSSSDSASPVIFPKDLPKSYQKHFTESAMLEPLGRISERTSVSQAVTMSMEMSSRATGQGVTMEFLRSVCEPFFNQMLEAVHEAMTKPRNHADAYADETSSCGTEFDENEHPEMDVQKSLKAIRAYNRWGKDHDEEIDSGEDADASLAPNAYKASRYKSHRESLQEAEALLKASSRCEKAVRECERCSPNNSSTEPTPCTCGPLSRKGNHSFPARDRNSSRCSEGFDSSQLIPFTVSRSHRPIGKRMRRATNVPDSLRIGRSHSAAQLTPPDALQAWSAQMARMIGIWTPTNRRPTIPGPTQDADWGWPADEDKGRCNPT